MSTAIELRAHVIDPDAERVMLVEQIMREHLSREQMHELRDALESVFLTSADGTDTTQLTNTKQLQAFIDAKRVENCTERTITYYESVITKFLDRTTKPIRRIDASDIRTYLSWLMTDRNCSAATVNNERRVLSTFFQWLENEDVIRKSPVKRVKALKQEQSSKLPFSDDELARMRDILASYPERDKAIFEFLLSSGVRVSELCGLDRNDIDYQARECEVFGKGRKRRMAYFSATAKMHLQRYVDSRADDNPALFVALRRPHTRLSFSAIEGIVRKIGKDAGVTNVHPHRFRRTMATTKLRLGMPLEEIQQLLGHSNMDTTLIYAKVDKEMLGVNARRLS